MMAKNMYYDEDMREDCKEVLSLMIKMYFKFAEKSPETMPPSVVFSADEIMKSIEDDDMSIKEMSLLYMEIVTELESSNMLNKFVKLPLLFLAKEIG